MTQSAGIVTGTIAITGGSGFIGRYLREACLAAGYHVRGLGRGGPEHPDDRQTDYSPESLRKVLDGVDAVVHLAGRRMTREDAPMDLTPFWQPNVAVIGNLMAAAQDVGVRKVVLASTIATYSIPSGLPYREDAPARPINAYALSKLMAEAHLELLARARGANPAPVAIALRLAAVYGHGEKGTPAMMKFIGQAGIGETIVLNGNPDYRIDQIYVRDAVDAFLAALRSENSTGVYNIGGGTAWSVGQIAETVNAVFGNDGNIRYETDSDTPMPHTVMDLQKAARDLGWSPAFDLRAGLTDLRKTRDAG